MWISLQVAIVLALAALLLLLGFIAFYNSYVSCPKCRERGIWFKAVWKFSRAYAGAEEFEYFEQFDCPGCHGHFRRNWVKLGLGSWHEVPVHK